ncbi:MAG TPA: 4-hydroxy-tetrahydrodipicolinate synthase [bacterium]|nr:4-hydroxy-tetrahydrodipicolinate synthase [bacterium]
MFEGCYVAMVTDFKNGQVNLDGAKALTRKLIDGGVSGLVPAGCTGEAATLSPKERLDLLKAVMAERGAKKTVKVVPGTGTNSTASTIELTRAAEDAGADAALIITPYYNKPTQAGLIKHYEVVASKVKLPIMVYNVPGRTAVNMLPETVAEIAKIENIVAIKEASGSVDQVSRIASLSDIEILSGDDSLTLPMLVVGARGVVSVAANVVPDTLSIMVRLFREGKIADARQIHVDLLPLFHVLFIETSPGPVKAALEMLGAGTGELRLPLVPVAEATRQKVRRVLEDLGLLGNRTVID